MLSVMLCEFALPALYVLLLIMHACALSGGVSNLLSLSLPQDSRRGGNGLVEDPGRDHGMGANDLGSEPGHEDRDIRHIGR